MGTLVFRKIRRSVSFGVWVRAGHDDPWTLWRSGIVTAQRQEDGSPDGVLRRTRDRECTVGLGDVPAGFGESRKIQALIRWKGFAQIEGIKLRSGPADPTESQPDPNPDIPKIVLANFDGGDYYDFEYSTGSEWAIPK